MNVFQTHATIVADYASYIHSFINIKDPGIRSKVDSELESGKLWPEPLLQFNPAYKQAGKVAKIAQEENWHPDLAQVFKGYSLYTHQFEAMRLGASMQDFVVTSGTGSGKSLTYIGSIINYLLSNPDAKGVTAIIVYPMNALINSQTNEFRTYSENYKNTIGKEFPITFGQYTGQEDTEKRAQMRKEPPQILLTNYMMLELLLTRIAERSIRDGIYDNLRFLVFDELHTYRGRQGADVALLIRRIKAKATNTVACIGTSATMVSAGTLQEQKEEVAKVATTVFGRPFTATQIINEKLDRSLSPSTPAAADLKAAIDKGVDITAPESELRNHPVAVWLEDSVAVQMRDGHLIRRSPMSIKQVVSLLAEASGAEPDKCRKCLEDVLMWISTINQKLLAGGSRYTILPFKLHQFISQTGSVYTTLDQDESRFITLEPGIYKQDDQSKKPIFPNVFSRASGHAFLCVSRYDDRLEPREFREYSEEDDGATDGYLIIGPDVWNPDEDLEYLPDSWLKKTKASPEPAPEKAKRFPRRLYFDETGRCSESEVLKYCGWFMSAPLLFDPTAGLFFDPKTNEGTKLTKLGSEGRSTSTTITAFSVLNRLHDAGYHSKDQKLLSFTDNVQDAALQAGHFNDFLLVTQLRSAIHKALADAPNQQLTYANIAEAVAKSLAIPFLEFANSEHEPPIPVIRKSYERAFQNFITYRIILDLRRGWRIVLPNLEQCGLLTIDYEYLDEVAAQQDFWSDVPFFSDCSVADRKTLIAAILDYFRLEYAIHSENYLTPSSLKENEKEFREKLKAPWTLDRYEPLREPAVLRLEPLHRSARLLSKGFGPTSSLGKFLKQSAKLAGIDMNLLKGDHYRSFILKLMKRLTEADYLYTQKAKSEKNEDVNVYLLRLNKIVWRLGDGETAKSDVIKSRSYKELSIKPNIFFRDVYRRDFSPAKRLRAADHTGHVKNEDRADREDRFRADWYTDPAKTILDSARIRRDSISALFCSPTMELGIDIGGLSVVHLRNSPPNPSNYAQRSGRAGRNGQGALIFTYCSSYSAHDRHYFDNQAALVAGVVQAPRLDLCNRELLHTHLNALAISEVGLPMIESQNGTPATLMGLVSDDNSALPLRSEVESCLQLTPGTFNTIKSAFRLVVKDFETTLNDKAAAWYSDAWVDQNLSSLADNLDRSLGRWRGLYQSARQLLTKATQPIESGKLSVGSDEYKKYKRQQDQANRQLNLLRNDNNAGSDRSEFYPYRYLASEGFFPGYNFTRLPIRIFLPNGTTSGDYISRPRFIALREFGPLNIIYYNGRKYQCSNMITPDADSALTEAKVSTKSGYFLTGPEKDREICPFSGVNLGDNANSEHLHDLLELSESRGDEKERITCEEEERTSKGFEIDTYFSVDGNQWNRVRKAFARAADTNLLSLRFIPAARLTHVNSKWRSMPNEGFPIGLSSGAWHSSIPDQSQNNKETFRLVKLFTSNLADALYIEPIPALGLKYEGVITLQYALKRAIEVLFQVEPNEIGVVTMGDDQSPNILIFEAAEGSLGILSQLVEDVTIFGKLVETAKKVCRYEDPTYLAPASYQDLLSYYNQRDHRIVDRFLIKDALDRLAACNIEIQTNATFQDYEQQYQFMRAHLDPTSSTEVKFIEYLYQNGLRLPDAAQKTVDGIYCKPDFYYDPRFWVFCDGTPHDDPGVHANDEVVRQLIMAKGDEVWSWHYTENLAAKIAQRPDIFKKVK